MRNSLKVLIAAFAIVALSAQVYAADPSGAVVSGEDDFGEFDTPGAGTVTIESGNITSAELSTNMSTYRWAGLKGNVTGSIVLGDDNNNTMYTWTTIGRNVYACNETIDWATLANASVTDMPTALAATDSEADRWNNTFTTGGTLDSELFSITANRSTTNSGGATNWYTYSLKDGNGALVWAGDVEDGGTDYKGTTADFQMIIGEDGTSGDDTPETFYLWVELA
ncbi:MAG: hypothetical protein JSW73_02605 [Candidatus Woesearchaeota archaeon]|nr:MAG: hypothetical protein JSW73_02605 [Candidatus Woesearchaeota archaeon]